MSLSEKDILYLDNHLIIVHKKPGELVQVDQTGDLSLEEKVKQYLKVRFQKPGDVFLGVIHRIDRPVSGAVVFARTSKALVRMNELIKKGGMKKIYWAIVKQAPQPESAELRHFLLRNPRLNKTTAFATPRSDAKESILAYRTIAQSDRYFLLEIDLITGRHHQIRAQLASINCPIRGDLKYGFARSNTDGGIDLHARQVSFIHPVSKELLNITCPVRNDTLWKSFEQSVV